MKRALRNFRVVTLTAAAVAVVGLASGTSGQGFHDMHHGAKQKPNYDSLLTAATPLSRTTEGQQVLEACIERYGGREKLETLRDFELTYETTSQFTDGPYTTVRSFQVGGRYRYRALGEERILNGKDCWFQTSEAASRLDSGRHAAELYSYLTLALPLAIHTERFDEVRYGERPGDPLAYIYLDKTDSLMIIVGIDRDDFLIRSVEGIVRQGGGEYVYASTFQNHQSRDGFLFAGEILSTSLGVEVAKATLEAVRVNPGFTEKDFQPRKKSAAGVLH